MSNFTVSPPFGVPACNCPINDPCIVVHWDYPQKMITLGLGAALFGVCSSVFMVVLLNKYNMIYPRMKRISNMPVLESVAEQE